MLQTSMSLSPRPSLIRLLGQVESGVPESSGTLTWWLGAPTGGVASSGRMWEERMSPISRASSLRYRENVDSEIGRHRRLFSWPLDAPPACLDGIGHV